MQSSLQALRLRLRKTAGSRTTEPVLRVGTTCVAALWDCGCASVGIDFDRMTYIPCWLHLHDMIAARPSTAELPSADDVHRELALDWLPSSLRPRSAADNS